MQIHTVPARAGFQWLKRGLQTFWRQPLAWTLLLAPFLTYALLMTYLTGVGTATGLALLPLLWLLMMGAATQVFASERLGLAALLTALRLRRDRLLAVVALGILGIAVAFGPLLLAALPDGGGSAGGVPDMDAMGRSIVDLLQDEMLQLCWIVWLHAVGGLFWFAPGLVLWHGVAPHKALWLSLRACLRNWRSLLVLSLSWSCVTTLLLAAALLIPLALVSLFPALVRNAVALILLLGVPAAATLWMLGIAWWVSAVFSLRDCFAAPPSPQPLA